MVTCLFLGPKVLEICLLYQLSDTKKTRFDVKICTKNAIYGRIHNVGTFCIFKMSDN